MRKHIALLIAIAAITIVTPGCANQQQTEFDPEKMSIQIKIVKETELPEGKAYVLKMENKSPYVIKQNSVFLSYPIISENVQKSNTCKVEAEGNKLDINPNESVNLNLFVNKANFESRKDLDTENPEIEFKCYINEVNEATRYEQSGSLEIFEMEE